MPGAIANLIANTLNLGYFARSFENQQLAAPFWPSGRGAIVGPRAWPNRRRAVPPLCRHKGLAFSTTWCTLPRPLLVQICVDRAVGCSLHSALNALDRRGTGRDNP